MSNLKAELKTKYWLISRPGLVIRLRMTHLRCVSPDHKYLVIVLREILSIAAHSVKELNF